MLLRRFIENVKTQNWAAVALDFIVVVVGVFIAFQVEQWYADRSLREVELSHLTSLQEDFRQTKEKLILMHGRYMTGSDAAIRLLEISRNKNSDVSHDEFYDLLGAALHQGRFEVIRRTWDVLTVGGEIGVIRNDALKAQIAAFFAEIDVVFQQYGDFVGMFDLHDAYFIESFDFVDYARYYHPGELSSVDANDPPILPTDELQSVTFRNVIVSRWHFNHDLSSRMSGLLSQIEIIEQMLAKSISELGGR